MRPVVEMKREIIQALRIGGDIHTDKIWSNPMLNERLLGAGFVKGEPISVCYKTFTDELFFVGAEREVTKEASKDEAKSASSSAGSSAGNR